MPIETESKFLVRGDTDTWRDGGPDGVSIKQGHLSEGKVLRSVRVRVQGDKGFLGIKSQSKGAARGEWEYSIDVADAEEMLRTRGLVVGHVIEKTRCIRTVEGIDWYVDEFHGDNNGLVVAEANAPGRLPHGQSEAWRPDVMPDWAGQCVNGVARYFNNRLVENPYTSWRHEHLTLPDGTVTDAVQDA